jgi:hypothetical protein
MPSGDMSIIGKAFVPGPDPPEFDVLEKLPLAEKTHMESLFLEHSAFIWS